MRTSTTQSSHSTPGKEKDSSKIPDPNATESEIDYLNDDQTSLQRPPKVDPTKVNVETAPASELRVYCEHYCRTENWNQCFATFVSHSIDEDTLSYTRFVLLSRQSHSAEFQKLISSATTSIPSVRIS